MTNTKTIPLDEVDLAWLTFQKATKTKSIKAKALSALLADETVLNKFLLDTLEGSQMLKSSSVVCMGEKGDVWQQSSEKLLAKYSVTKIDKDGWMHCSPKPENEVLAAQVPDEVCLDGNFILFGLWGDEQVLDGKQRFIQYGELGDYVLQSISDPNDRWIVKRSFFESTYEIK